MKSHALLSLSSFPFPHFVSLRSSCSASLLLPYIQVTSSVTHTSLPFNLISFSIILWPSFMPFTSLPSIRQVVLCLCALMFATSARLVCACLKALPPSMPPSYPSLGRLAFGPAGEYIVSASTGCIAFTARLCCYPAPLWNCIVWGVAPLRAERILSCVTQCHWHFPTTGVWPHR